MKSLKQLKEECALTYQQISDRSGVPVSTIHRVIEGHAKNPGYDTVTAIRDALDDAPDEEPPPEIDCHTCPRDMPTRQDYAQMSASYQQQLKRIEERFSAALEGRDKQFAAERAVYARWLRVLAIACAALVLFVMLLLVIDITNPHVGWARTL